MSLLGIDVGTSGCKAGVFSTTGALLSLAYQEYDYLHEQPGWAELDTGAVWAKIQATLRQAAGSEAVRGDPIQALCVSSLGEAVVPVGRNCQGRRQPLANSRLNFDTRGDETLPALRSGLAAERLYALNGNTLGSPYSLTKLLSIRNGQPELYERADYFLHWSGFVAFMLGAEPQVDYSLANRTLLFDLQQEDWSDELLAWAGLGREKLPPCVPSGQVIGAVSPEAAADLGLPAGIPIVSGAHDQCCNAVGCGVIEPGLAVYGMGTFICMTPVFTRRPPAGVMMAGGLNTEHHAVPGQYVSFLYNQGGSLVKWHRDTFAWAEKLQAQAAGQDIYPALFAEMPAEPSTLLALPHFTITGPPEFIGDSSGVLVGLKLETRRGEILKALVEGATFYMREILESLPPTGIEIEEFRAVGGGSKSDAWVQLSADILGRPLVKPKFNEAGVLGAAILAGTGSGVFGSVQEGVDHMVQLGAQYTPDITKQAIYLERFEKYRKLWLLLRGFLSAGTR